MPQPRPPEPRLPEPRPPHDIRKTEQRSGPRDAGGDGAAYREGYGAGGLSSGVQPHDSWDAPGVAPDGRRTGSSTDGPRIAMDGESEPDPEPADPEPTDDD